MLINEFGKASKYKIKVQKSLALLYTKMKNQKEKLRNQSYLLKQQKE